MPADVRPHAGDDELWFPRWPTHQAAPSNMQPRSECARQAAGRPFDPPLATTLLCLCACKDGHRRATALRFPCIGEAP
jgi:hypothetical protein